MTYIFLQAQPLNTPEFNEKEILTNMLFLSKYISIPSETGNEEKAANLFRDECARRGLHITMLPDSAGSVNFAASLYPLSSGLPNIVFLTHSDIVSAGDTSNWNYPPYDGVIADGKLWGRGAFDNKGLGVTQLAAVSEFAKLNDSACRLSCNVTILCVSGEETGGLTGSAICARDFKEIFNPLVVIGEGGSGMNTISFIPEGKTFFAISITEKSFLWLRLTCAMESPGHSSIAGYDCANAHIIKAVAEIMNDKPTIRTTPESRLMFFSLGKHIGGIKGYLVRHINWIGLQPIRNYFIRKNPEINAVMCNTIAVTSIGTENKNPNRRIQEATAILDCRLLPGTTPSQMINYIKKIVNDPLVEISVIQTGAPLFTSEPDLYFNFLSLSIRHIYKDSEVVPMLFPASSDNSYFRAAGCPVFGLNPWVVSSEQMTSIHNYNEFIDIEDIGKGSRVFVEFIRMVNQSLLDSQPSSITKLKQKVL